MKIKKGIPLIDQHDKNGFWGGKFGGSFVPETLIALSNGDLVQIKNVN